MAVKLHVVMTIPGKEPREFEYEFDQERITIGRDQNNDIQVPLSTVSRAHCVFFLDGGEWYLEDLKSTHGTRHNGKPVGAGGKKLLRDGDSVELVHFKMTFINARVVSADYSVERTEALARKMVEEVLASIGKEGDLPYLRVMNGPDEGKRFPVGTDVTEATLGRGADCDFQINDANISRRHAIVRRDWSEITIEDCGSKNGVVINDRKVARPTALRDADEIHLGAVKLTFIDPSAKFLGKLDDIPAFQDAATSAESPAVSDEGEPEDVVDDGGGFAGDVHPDLMAETGGGDDAGEVPGPAYVEEDEGEFDDEEEPPPKRALGIFEISLIGLAVVAVVGLGVGIAILFATG